MVQWQLVTWNFGNWCQVLVHEAVVFWEDVPLLVVWQVHVVGNALPTPLFVFGNVKFLSNLWVNLIQDFQRVLERPPAKQVGVPVVVYVVVVFVRTRNGVEHVLVLVL